MWQPIMLGSDGKTRAPKGDNRGKWAGYVVLSLFIVAATIGAVMHFEHGNRPHSSSQLAVETAQMCDACNAIPGFDEYQTCRSCYFKVEEDKALSCNSGYGDLKITKVKHASGSDFALIAESCEDQEEEFDFSTGEAFTCNVNLEELRMQDAGAEIDYVDEYTGAEGTEQIPLLSQPGRGEGDHHHHHGRHHHEHTHHDGIKIEYVCSKLETEMEPVEPAFMLRSTHRVAPQADEPFLSSALMHCGRSKILAETVQVSKYCGSDNFELTCDADGDDPRIIVLKFKESGKHHSHKRKKAGKARAKLVTDACVGTGASCNFTPDAFATESETTADFAGKKFEIKYLCSYGSALAVEAPGGELNACCKALTPQCMACVEGITEAEYCGRAENAEICGELRLSSRYEAPSDLLLESALVKCGNTKQVSNTVDFGKVCSDNDFELTCDNTRSGARIVVLKFKDTAAEKPVEKAAKKEWKKGMKVLAAAATDLCDAQRDSASCTFGLEDVLDASTDMTTLVDHVFNVKYLCSYDA